MNLLAAEMRLIGAGEAEGDYDFTTLLFRRGEKFIYMSVKQAAEKWGISDRRVRILCSERKIPGVIQAGRRWKIPEDAKKPEDGRYRSAECLLEIIDRKKAEFRSSLKYDTSAFRVSRQDKLDSSKKAKTMEKQRKIRNFTVGRLPIPYSQYNCSAVPNYGL